MEKIVIGAPYEIIIEPSIDIGKFESELIIYLEDSRIGVELKKIKGEKNSYSFIIPTTFKVILKKSEVDYCICVYKENAKFEVDSGKLKFIDEKDFKVKVKNNSKMRKIEEPEEDKTEPKSKDDKQSPTVESVDPETLAERMIESQNSQVPIIDDFDIEASVADNPIVTESPVIQYEPKPTSQEHNLKEILNQVEQRKREQARKKKINEDIQKAIKNG